MKSILIFIVSALFTVAVCLAIDSLDIKKHREDFQAYTNQKTINFLEGIDKP